MQILVGIGSSMLWSQTHGTPYGPLEHLLEDVIQRNGVILRESTLVAGSWKLRYVVTKAAK